MRCNTNTLYDSTSQINRIKYSLFDLASWKNGLAFKNINFSDSGIPVIKISELNNGIGSTTKYTNQKFSDDIYLLKNDLVFSWSGNPETSIDIFRFQLEEGWLNQHIFKVVPNQQIIDKDYFYFLMKWLKPRFIQIACNKQTIGLGHITITDIKYVKVILPDMNTQKKIASFLKSIDDLIIANQQINHNLCLYIILYICDKYSGTILFIYVFIDYEQINHNLEEQAKAIFKSWFIDNIYSTEIDFVPLSELCSTITKGTTPTTIGKSFSRKGIRFIKAEAILENHAFNMSKLSYINEGTHTLLKRSIIEKGDIVFTIAGTLGRYALVDDNILPANTNQAVAVIRPNKMRVSSEYIYSAFLANWHNHYYKSRIQQAVQANLSLTTIKSLPFPLLNQTNMRTYNKIISPIIELTKQNQHQISTLTTLRDTLLPKLMSGEIDVSAVEIGL